MNNMPERTLWIPILFILILSGCTGHRVNIPRNQLNLSSQQAAHLNQKSLTVYAVEFEQFDTTIWVKKFGIKQIDKQTIEILHGISYDIEHQEISPGLMAKLELVLRKYQYEDIEAFIKAYSSGTTLFPDSKFIPVPQDLGSELFWIASESDHDSDPVSILP